jgi:hypothetical protein
VRCGNFEVSEDGSTKRMFFHPMLYEVILKQAVKRNGLLFWEPAHVTADASTERALLTVDGAKIVKAAKVSSPKKPPKPKIKPDTHSHDVGKMLAGQQKDANTKAAAAAAAAAASAASSEQQKKMAHATDELDALFGSFATAKAASSAASAPSTVLYSENLMKFMEEMLALQLKKKSSADCKKMYKEISTRIDACVTSGELETKFKKIKKQFEMEPLTFALACFPFLSVTAANLVRDRMEEHE